MFRPLRLLTPIAIFVVMASAAAQEVWDEADTAIANHYIQSLQKTPEYGKVLDLLWEHYEKHDQTRLLLQYFDQAAQSEDALTAKLINGHLLRKKGNIEAALEAYEAVYAQTTENVFVVRALAQTHRAAEHVQQASEFYAQLAKLEGPGAESWVSTQLIRAELLRELTRIDEAVEVWEETLAQRPGDLELRKQIVAQLLEEGRTAEAIEIFQTLTNDQDPERRLLALKELGRLYEFIDDFDNAVATYRSALSTIHFKHFLYDEFTLRLVRVHERFSRIEELEERWTKAASDENPTEAALLRIVKFYELTAEPKSEEEWLVRLTEHVPLNTIYRQQLAELFIENDKYNEAGELAEELAEKLKPTPVTIALLQTRVALSLYGVETGEQLLSDYLERHPPTREGLKRLLRFAQTHYLDNLTERLLIDQQANGWAEEGQIPEMKLAAFHHERGRLQKVHETLNSYIEKAPTPQQRGERLLRAAEMYRELRMLRESQAAIKEAQDLGQAKRSHFMVLAETFVELRDPAAAIETFQTVWEMSTTTEQRVEVDARIFSVLRATGDAETIEGDSPPVVEGDPFSGLWAFYTFLKKTAEAEPESKNRFRVAWWAIRVEDTTEAYKQLPMLHNPADPVMAYEEMLLDLAERTENRALILRQLELISKIDPSREEDFLIRKALMRLELRYEDEAVRTLRNLVDRPGSSLKAVQALAKAYKHQDRTRALEELWRAAFEKANLLERRQIVKPFTNALIELGQLPDALEVQSRMIEAESDLAQRRKLLEDQLSFATDRFLLEDWMLPRYTGLAREQPLDRFYPEALARVHLALGNIDEAFSAMKRAYYMSNNDADLLEQLGELASKSSDLKSAIYYQRQLIAAEDDETSPDEWLALIQRLEDDLRVNEADLTRRRLESKFGQDPEFLRQLGIHYLNAGDRTSARRVLEKIATLRPWDAETLLELGLLAVELGDETRAVQLFDRILDETAESAPPADSKLEKLPFVAAHRERPKPGQAIGLGLETYAENVEDFDQLPDPWTDLIANWLREAKPEFTRKPSAVEDLRLRAIEELARLVGEDEDWRQVWTDPESASPTERIWALSHSKDGNAGTQQLLDDHIRPRTGETEQIGRWDFLYVLQTLRSGEIESLASWLDEQPAREATILLGVQILLRDRHYVFDNVRLRQALQLLDLTIDQVREQMHSIRLDQRLPEALAFGSILAETLELEDYRLSSDLASLCRQLGRTEQRQRWLEFAFEQLTEPGAGFGYSFFDTISSLYQLQETAEGQQEIVDRVNNAIAHLPDWEDDKLEAPIWLAIASNQPDLALERVAVMSKEQEEIRKSYRAFKYVRGPMTPDVELDLEIELWMRLESMLNLLAGRLPRSHFAQLTEAIDSFELHEPEDEIAGSQFTEFKALRLLWKLEAANPPQRARMIAEFLGEANSRDEYIELGRSLEARNLAPDAIPLYRFLIDANSADFSTVRSYLNCCRQGRSYDEALELLESYLHGRLQRPESMTEAYIHRNYSNMLFLAERVDKLAEICSTQSGAAFAEVIRDKQIRAFYQRHLISLYRKQDDLDAAIAVFRAMKQNDSLTREDRLDWADVLEAQGDIEGAIGLLSQFSLKGHASEESQIVKRLGRLHAKAEEPDTNKLIELAKLSLTYRDSPTLAREMADHLITVGRAAIADSILTRKARTEYVEGVRFDLLLRQTKLRIDQGAKDSSKESVRQLLASWGGHLHDGEAFLDFVADTAADEADFWKEALAEVRDSGRAGLLARAAELYVGGEAEAALTSINEAASADEMRVLVQALMRNGAEKIAAEVLTDYHATSREHPLLDAALEIELYTRLGDDAALAEVHGQALRHFDTPTRMAQIANAFADQGHAEMAASVFEAHFQKLRVLTVDQQYFLEQYASFLMEQKEFSKAERVLMSLFNKPIGGDPHLLTDLFGKWNRLEEIEPALRKFYLDNSTKTEVVSNSARYPNHRPDRDVKDYAPSQQFQMRGDFRDMRRFSR